MYIVIAVLFFGFLVVIHEFGHFITAKWFGVQVNEFAVGMGPAILKKQKGETLYSLRAIPFGGYCAMQGEDASNSDEDDERSLSNKSIWKRLVIFFSGSFMNFLVGFLIIFGVVIVYNFGEASIFLMVKHSWNLCIGFVDMVWESLGMLFSGEAGLNDLSGPVGIVDMMADTAANAESKSDAALTFFYMGSLIAVNISIMNLLPIPGLDGGHIFLMLVSALVEKISGKKLNPKYQSVVNAAGLILLLGLMAYIMFQDIIRVFFNG